MKQEQDPHVAGEHIVKETSSFTEYYPDHPPRSESALFRKTKKHWHDLGTGCHICGGHDSIEIHHAWIEWAFAGAVDWDKVKAAHPSFDWSSFKEATDFVDSIYNTVPLCAKHHRAPNHGVHHLPMPNWLIQKYVRDDFVLTSDQNNNNKGDK
ncbi:hypothetical protein [Burkholderia guangdongensis]|uniref:hypothetical protein n=1 Tax=Burkholderia guangdongensis TaxID=1792500 RepID=UPI0015C70002|nr:hypothetical protein [Burkholderia guangdongensis]